MVKISALLIFLITSTFGFAASLKCPASSSDLISTLRVNHHPSTEQYQSTKAIVSAQTAMPRSGNTDTKLIQFSDPAIHGTAISICHHDLELIEIFTSYVPNEHLDAFTDPPHQTAFFNLLFRVIISPNAP